MGYVEDFREFTRRMGENKALLEKNGELVFSFIQSSQKLMRDA